MNKPKSVKSGDASVIMEALEERAFFRKSAREEVAAWAERKAQEAPVPPEVQKAKDQKMLRKGKIILACFGAVVLGLILFFMRYV
ncbi:MAG: hypothetical protein MR303_12050 [Emergencia sp.]|nr:hypothetical protein [Emergencia sp.]